MKKTGFEKSFNFKQILITLAAGAAVLLPVRIYQLFAIIDTGSTGFYKKINFSVYFMYVAVVVFTALLIVFSRLCINIGVKSSGGILSISYISPE